MAEIDYVILDLIYFVRNKQEYVCNLTQRNLYTFILKFLTKIAFHIFGGGGGTGAKAGGGGGTIPTPGPPGFIPGGIPGGLN